MRLLCTLDATTDPAPLFHAFDAEGILYECEDIEPQGTHRIWIVSEEDMERAISVWHHTQLPLTDPFSLPPIQPRSMPPVRALGTLALLVLSALLLVYHLVATKPANPTLPGILPGPGVARLEESLLFDFPEYFILREKLEPLLSPSGTLYPPGPALVHRMETMPLWMGLCPLILPKSDVPRLHLSLSAFGEKIRTGEVWRAWTPVLLHVDFLHFFFNATWIWLLGNLIETKLGTWRYLALLFLIGVASNLAQYCMTGPFFMGLSGIVCGLAAFIWVRQKRAPWEGYRIAPFVLLFLFFFIGGMVILEWISFGLTLWKGVSLPVTIANTAHVTGAMVGGLLALPLRLLQPRNIT